MKAFTAALVGILVGSSAAKAESALQQFRKTIPRHSQYNFAIYQACALSAGIDGKNAHKPFEVIEAAIAAQCKRYIVEADRDMASTGIGAEQRSQIIENFARLSIEERRLSYDGKPIPGYEMDPWTKKTLACLDTNKIREAINSCAVDELRPLLAFSQEQPEAIATTVESACQKPIAQLRSQLQPCVGIEGIGAAVAPYLKALHDSVIAAVVKERAARAAAGPKP